MADTSAPSCGGYNPMVACKNAPYTLGYASYQAPIALRTVDNALGKGLVSSVWNDEMLSGQKEAQPSKTRKRQSTRIKEKTGEKKMKENPRPEVGEERKSKGREGQKEISTSSSNEVDEKPSIPPPATVSPASAGTISMVVDCWDEGQVEQFSAVHRIDHFPWRLRLYTTCDPTRRILSLVCDKSTEAELWQCLVSLEDQWNNEARMLPFSSWIEGGRYIALEHFTEGAEIRVQITTKLAQCARVRPILDPFEQRDGILVIGDDEKTIHVHRKSLTSQSSFFEQLFHIQAEIRIKDVEYEEFANIIKMVYGFDSVPLSACNVNRILVLANRFEFKIVEDRVVNFLLSSSNEMSIHARLLIADQLKIDFLKMKLLVMYTRQQFKELSESIEWDQLSAETTREVMNKVCSFDPIETITIKEE